MSSWLLVAVPLVGAGLSLLCWSSPRRMKLCVVLTTAAACLGTIILLGDFNDPSISMPVLLLIPLGAFLSLLGQPLHPNNRLAWLLTVVLLGLVLGILTSRDFAGDLLLVILFGILCALMYRHRAPATPGAWSGMVTYGIGMASALLALALSPSMSVVPMLVACGSLLPLFPLHGGFIAALTRLPGNLPALLALLLPLLGFHRLALLLPQVPIPMIQTLVILALIGACYGSLRTFAQLRVPARLAYGGMAFFGVLWWSLAETRIVPVHSTVYVSALGLALSGLLLAWYAVRARYGDTDLRALGGMVYPMPRFSTLLSLLALAALGMPPFGLFAGFMGMLLSPAFMPSAAFAVIMLIWLSASWYYIDLVQLIIFGRQRPDLRYEDLHRTEAAALLMIVLLLVALGIAPSRFFQPGATPLPDAVATTAVTWH
jgi:NADH-quinone oxidoreductase subunit M